MDDIKRLTNIIDTIFEYAKAKKNYFEMVGNVKAEAYADIIQFIWDEMDKLKEELNDN